jgi:hypothetical protein
MYKRAIKYLFRGTRLERMFRFRFGLFILALVAGSFLLIANYDEALAYAQIDNNCRLLVVPLIAQENIEKDHREALKKFRVSWQEAFPESLSNFKHRFLKPNSGNPEYRYDDSDELDLIKKFQDDPNLQEAHRGLLTQGVYHYYAAIRAGSEELLGEPKPAAERPEGELIAVLRISVPTEAIERGRQLNRAFLVSTAIVTAGLIMFGSNLIFRYVIRTTRIEHP